MGTRFLPATKAQPKEMLPIVDKPLIQYIVEQAVEAGITDIIIITGKTKRAVEDHFDRDEDLERWLLGRGKKDYCDSIKKIAMLANFIYIRQKGPYGNGTPVLNAKPVIGKEPFAVVWGDELWHCAPGRPHLKQLIQVYEKYTDPVITLKPIDDEGTGKYGVVDGVKVEKDVYEIKSIVEKPGPKKAPSRLGSFGGYILTPDIFQALEKTKLGKGGELWLVDAIAAVGKNRPLYGKVIDGIYYDSGSKLSWLKANMEYGLRDGEIGKEFGKYLKKII